MDPCPRMHTLGMLLGYTYTKIAILSKLEVWFGTMRYYCRLAVRLLLTICQNPARRRHCQSAAAAVPLL